MKLFTNSYLNDHDILKKAKIGFEFEFFSRSNYPITLEILNRELNPIKVWGFKQYHSSFKPDELNFKLEPDISGGFQMAELVTGPMDYVNARLILSKILKILQQIATTTDRSSIHINISFPEESGKNIEKLNILKLILNLEETKIYNVFPDRKESIYAKSIKNIIPFKEYDYTAASSNILLNSLMLPNTKYYGVNFSTMVEGRLEFRYLGGENYQYKVNEILELVDYFTLLTWNCIGEPLDADEAKLLRTYLDENIRKYKDLNKLDNFMAQYPTVEIQVDKHNDYELINPYYSHIYEQIFQLVAYTKHLHRSIINFDTETKKIEVVGGDPIEFIGSINNIDFIGCELIQGEFTDCTMIKCKIDKAMLVSSIMQDCEVIESKLLSCKVDERTSLDECYFTEGFMDGQMKNGVFRSGKIGENGYISPETKVLNDEQNFFNIKLKDQGFEKGKKGFTKK